MVDLSQHGLGQSQWQNVAQDEADGRPWFDLRRVVGTMLQDRTMPIVDQGQCNTPVDDNPWIDGRLQPEAAWQDQWLFMTYR